MADHARELVFVYGTLRRGGVNHGLIREARFLRRHRTRPAFTMLDLGPYPGVIRPGRTAVLGEVYAVDEALLQRIDELEDYPEVYTRERVTTPDGDAWMYLYRCPAAGLPRVAGGDWLRYRRRR